MPTPPLFQSRPPVVQLFLGIGLPAVFGALCGILLGVSKAAYTAVALALLLGSLAAGYEHRGWDAGMFRGICGGAVFGAVLLIVHSATGVAPTTKLPHPPAMLAVIAAVAAGLFGAAGGALRLRRDRKEAERLAEQEDAAPTQAQPA